MRVVRELPPELVNQFQQMEQEAFSYLVAGNFEEAAGIYERQYDILKIKEQQLPEGEKYHKGGPLYNWGISLLYQSKILLGFQKIALAYIEDLLDSSDITNAFEAPAYKTLQSYPLISNEFKERLKELANNRRVQNRVPRNPEEIMQEYPTEGYADLSASFTINNIEENPITIKQLEPQIQNQLGAHGPKEKRVFVGGSYRNIALLRYIAYQIVQNFNDFKAILPIDLPKLTNESYDHLIHDVSMEYLKGCSFAIFEVSITNGHLMEIERARDIEDLKVVLVFQKTKPEDEPTITRMVLTTNYRKIGYRNLAELTKEIGHVLEG